MSIPDFGSTAAETQIAMGLGIPVGPCWDPWDSANLPAYASALSLSALTVMSCWNFFKSRTGATESAEDDPSLSKHVPRHTGSFQFGLQSLRAGMCIALLSLSWFTRTITPISITAAFTYAGLLSILVLVTPRNLSNLSAQHANAILTVSFAIYAYRDLFPLTTFQLTPQDEREGAVVWWKIGILGIVALLPLFMPREYKPVNPKKPSTTPHPEQTASLFSLIGFFFVDKILFLASRVSHMSVDQMLPLADYDAAEHLREKSASHVPAFGGVQRQHIFWSLFRLVRRDYANMVIMLVIHTIGKFTVPVSVNQLLRYLESSNNESFVRPWFWVLMIFVGPNVASLSIEQYMLSALRSLARINSILTQVIFAHALHIRMKAQASPIHKTPTPSVAALSEGELHTDQDSVEAEYQEGLQATETQTPEIPVQETQKGSSLIGKINNLVTTDVNNILNGPHLPYLVAYVPLQLAFSLMFLYSILGWSAFVAFGCTLLLLPVPGYLASLTHKIQSEKMKRTDERVEVVTETMKVLRMVKLFGWEDKMSRLIAEKREQELKWIRRHWRLQLITQIINFLIPVITMVACYFTFIIPLNALRLTALTVIMKKELKASVVFSSITVFEFLRTQCTFIVQILGKLIMSKVSLDRINEFLVETELLDAFSPDHSDQNAHAVVSSSEIGVHEALFTWSNETYDDPLAYQARFVLSVEGTLKFKRGCLNLIVGPTGSGKTSLLMALLGELHFIPLKPDSYVSLPRGGGLAYAAQESWVQNDTIRGNILFNSLYDEERYQKVIYQCGLERDLGLFDAGDMTEVGEKGITLSGGQKARITLARAVYSSAEILLLDDILAALDVHTARWIVNKCLRGDLLQGRTVILVVSMDIGLMVTTSAHDVIQTHNLPLTLSLAESVISVKDGKVSSADAMDVVLDQDTPTSEEQETQFTEKEDGLTPPSDTKAKADGKLIVAEEVQMGRVSFSAVKLYLSAFGGNHAAFAMIIYAGGLLVSGILNVVQTWYLGYWATQYELLPPSEVPIFRHLGMYCVARSADKFRPYLRILLPFGCESVKDDSQEARGFGAKYHFEEFGILATKMITQLGALAIYTPIFVIPGVVVASVGNWFGRKYIAAVLCTRREMSNAKAPVLAQFETAIAGIVSIRAYGASDVFEEELRRRIDVYTRISRTLFSLTRWMASRVEFLGALFSSGLAAYLVYYSSAGASGVGFSLNMAVTFTNAILFFIFYLNDLEMNANSLERIEGYLNIEQEPSPTKRNEPPAYWPASGDLRAENLSARYSPEGPRVLHNLNFHIRSGERIGVVGRTGSGKSTFTLSLLRCIPNEGDVYYDGLKTSSINLDALRSKITIIPQMPELLSGSLRQNLDPFGQHDDATLNDALRSAGLFELQKAKREGRITLDTGISSGGTNLSVGQRQIIALARAILRKSKVLILDEATSAIDYETDTIIQQSLRNELGGDTTVITIAHRLQTIMDADRIMVLDAGKIVEFDSPKELLRKEDGLLRALVNESADKGVLFAMAAAKTGK
ncbi:hypothetical protein VNI00_015819 [Paramarasmius palmivorus]|uniref:P-loop containing nucleoside triphosphate hydrolase protein n=1 Tax=Paramarasmius palmivorus TaxID=297713 RepID=A0AAW0BJ98_9AGAR